MCASGTSSSDEPSRSSSSSEVDKRSSSLESLAQPPTPPREGYTVFLPLARCEDFAAAAAVLVRAAEGAAPTPMAASAACADSLKRDEVRCGRGTVDARRDAGEVEVEVEEEAKPGADCGVGGWTATAGAVDVREKRDDGPGPSLTLRGVAYGKPARSAGSNSSGESTAGGLELSMSPYAAMRRSSESSVEMRLGAGRSSGLEVAVGDVAGEATRVDDDGPGAEAPDWVCCAVVYDETE